MANGLQRVKLVMLLLGSIFGAAVGIRELSVTLGEAEPTPFDAAGFVDAYDGEQWLEVRGRVATEHAHVRPSTHKVHSGKGLAYVHVPIVAAEWRPSAPVHVVATFGPVAENQPLDWDTLTQGEDHISGQVRPSPLPDPEAMFPGLSIPDAPVVVNAGTEPSPPLMIGGFTLMMLVTALLCAVALRNELADDSAG